MQGYLYWKNIKVVSLVFCRKKEGIVKWRGLKYQVTLYFKMENFGCITRRYDVIFKTKAEPLLKYS